MPSGIYPRTSGVKRGPYRKKPRAIKPKKPRVPKKYKSKHTTKGLGFIFDLVYWSRGIDPLPPKIRAKVERVKARRKEAA